MKTKTSKLSSDIDHDDQIEEDWRDEDDKFSDNDEGHEKLLQAVKILDKNRRAIQPRVEPAVSISDIYTGADRGKVKVHELVGSLKQETRFGVLKKQLTKVQRQNKVLPTPLPKPEQERVERSVAYDETKKEVAKWDSVVNANRKAEQLQFPLLQPNVRLVTTSEVVRRLKPNTPLEMEIAAILEGREAPNDDVAMTTRMLTLAEQRAQTAMSLQEARERREELQKLRALISYQETKARRRGKIKSKRFHRILKKEKLKKEKQLLEESKDKDPEAAETLLLKMEKDRATERMTQRHRTGSKFMLRQKLFGRYDDQARKAIDEMIEHGKKLKQKTAVVSDSDEEEQEDGETGATNGDANLETSNNPWMSAGTASNVYQRPGAFQAADHRKALEAEESDESEEDTSSKTRIPGVILGNSSDGTAVSSKSIQKQKAAAKSKTSSKAKVKKGSKKAKGKKKTDAKESTANANSEDNGDDIDRRDDGAEDSLVTESLTRVRTLDDIENTEWDEDEISRPPVAVSKTTAKTAPTASAKAADVVLDVAKVITVERRLGGVSRIAQEEDGEDDAGDDDANDEERRMTIAQAFASDDVVGEFAADKRATEDRDKPKDIDLTLPGWGDWGGGGLQPSRRKRKRFTVKAVDAGPRKDRDLDNVIISETKDTTISKYQVNQLPFPFASVAQFESSIRAPVGKTWVPETSYRQLIQPKKVTSLGAIIEPISKEATFGKKPLPRADTMSLGSGTKRPHSGGGGAKGKPPFNKRRKTNGK